MFTSGSQCFTQGSPGSQCFTSISCFKCFTMFINVLQCLVSSTTIGIATSTTAQTPITAEIGYNSTGIADATKVILC